MNPYDTNYLEHYGILGMRWGHHKAEARADREIKKARRQLKKDVRLLSEQEIDQYISRLSKEQKLRELLSKDRSTSVSKTKQFLEKTGEQIVSRFLVDNTVNALNSKIGYKGSLTTKAASAVTNKFRRKQRNN